MTAPLLEVEDLKLTYHGTTGSVHALRGVSLEVERRERIGIVGESGSGKSVFARAVMGLTTTEIGAERTGAVRLDGSDLTDLGRAELRRRWGNDIGMIFQDPLTSLNPVRTIGAHFRVPLKSHLGLNRRDGRERARELLAEVGMADPRGCLDLHPHQLSGGMRQRVMIALAVSCHPKVLIADEPTTALDVTVQRQVLDLLDRLRDELDMATLLITHDLSVVAGHVDRIMVMYAGRPVEIAPVTELFARPRHPYTEALLGAVPSAASRSREPLRAIAGSPPDLRVLESGCSFVNRCERATDLCHEVRPELLTVGDGPSHAACHHPIGASQVPRPSTSPEDPTVSDESAGSSDTSTAPAGREDQQ